MKSAVRKRRSTTHLQDDICSNTFQEKTMASTTREQPGKAPTQPAIALAEMAVRGVTQIYGLQMSAIRALTETHARSAAAFGFPDWTEWLRNGSEESLRQAAVSTAEQVIATARRTNEAITRLGGNFNELFKA